METKPLVYAIIGFLLGGFLVSLVAVTIESGDTTAMDDHSSMSMNQMNKELATLSGKEFDEAYLSMMIAHHEGATEMANLAEDRADRQEIKDLSDAIISAQEVEIKQMQQWQMDWGLEHSPSEGMENHEGHSN